MSPARLLEIRRRHEAALAKPVDPRSPHAEAFGLGPARPGPGPPLSVYERMEMGMLLQEWGARRKEALRLYRPWPVQEEFHKSRAGMRLARGSNRGGKTLAAAAELARAVTHTDPHGKYPAKGRAIVVGKDLLHCSKVIYRKLFKPGAFKIIRDAESLEWRVFAPEVDGEREAEAEEAPPLISPRFYSPRAMSWENKREEICRSVRFYTGWELTFFSGEGEPPQGWDVDLILFDEEIPHPRWFPEMVPRLVDRGGRFIWSFTPQAGTLIAYELYERAIADAGSPDPRVEDFLMTISDNPYIGRAAKEQFHRDLEHDEEELKVRYYGDFALKGMRVYPEFQKGGIHRIDSFEPPADWTRYIACDPGRRVAAALFVAVPPPNCPMLDRPVVYREVYSRSSTAAKFAEEVKQAVGEHHVQDWLIDHMHGRKHEASGVSIEEQYADAFRKAGLEAHGFNGFIWAVSDVAAGKLAAKGKLQIVDGGPGWYFMTDELQWFVWEIEKYVDRRMTRGGYIVDDVSRSNLHNHLMDDFRYLAAHNVCYRRPPGARPGRNWVLAALDRKRKKKSAQDGWGDAIRLA